MSPVQEPGNLPDTTIVEPEPVVDIVEVVPDTVMTVEPITPEAEEWTHHLHLKTNALGWGPVSYTHLDVYKRQIYGSRAAAGVIMIMTKGGKRNQKPVINYSDDYSITSLVSDVNTLTTDEVKMLVMEAVRNGAKAEGYDDITQYSKYSTFAASDFFGEANTPWMKYIMRDRCV